MKTRPFLFVLSFILFITVIHVNGQSCTGGSIGSGQTICSGGNPSLLSSLASPSGTGTLTLQWQSFTSSSGLWSSISGATGYTYDPPPGLMETTQYRRVATFNNGGVICVAYSTPVAVAVRIVTGGTIAGDQTMCSGGNPAAFTE